MRSSFWAGFEKHAALFSINHKLDPNTSRDIQQKIDLSVSNAAQKITEALQQASRDLERTMAKTPLTHRIDPKSSNQLVSKLEGSSGKIIKQIESATKRIRKIESGKLLAPAMMLGGGLVLGQGIAQFLSNVVKRKDPQGQLQPGRGA